MVGLNFFVIELFLLTLRAIDSGFLETDDDDDEVDDEDEVEEVVEYVNCCCCCCWEDEEKLKRFSTKRGVS